MMKYTFCILKNGWVYNWESIRLNVDTYNFIFLLGNSLGLFFYIFAFHFGTEENQINNKTNKQIRKKR